MLLESVENRLKLYIFRNLARASLTKMEKEPTLYFNSHLQADASPYSQLGDEQKSGGRIGGAVRSDDDGGGVGR